MGAEHKLDLTSDVTHLLVGDTDTPKYKYVAKEREDVRVLKPEWVAAVRKQWMEAKQIDLNALYVEFRMPTLAGSRICITGFDDLKFRAQLQKSVLENGGEYTGDLTKDVTHLIARRPEGKKYEYGMQWQKKVVSLEWYKDTLRRGMQLEESSYHPTIPQDQQGAGAWNRSASTSQQLGKRVRDEAHGPEPPRKLRRTASARLNSQNDDMWSDLTRVDNEQSHTGGPVNILKPSKSMPHLQSASANIDGQSAAAEDCPHAVSDNQKTFSAKYFAISGFSPEREKILKNVVRSHGGTLVDSISQLRELHDAKTNHRILLVPFQTPVEQLPSSEADGVHFQVTSELWVEHCMFNKLFTPPDQYPLGRLLPKIKPPGFSKLVITSTGFSGIVPNHIAKMVRHLGATYEQTFTRNTSILVCNRTNQSQAKLAMAKSWAIPAVAESWVWTCVLENRRASFEAHALNPPKTSLAGDQTQATTRAETLQQRVARPLAGVSECLLTHQPVTAQSLAQTSKAGMKSAREGTAIERPGSDFRVHKDVKSSTAGIVESETDQHEGEMQEVQPLQHISPNRSPVRPSLEAVKPKRRLFQPFDGPSSDIENLADPQADTESDVPRTDRPAAGVANVHSLNSEIRELLDSKTKLREQASGGTSIDGKSKKKLMGRALSNLSNSSNNSYIRQSRASSVDSVNTDGIGSEIGLMTSINSRAGEKIEGSVGFVGRARSRLQEGGPASAVVSAAAAYDAEEEHWSEEAPAPALTQLVYEDPEEAIQLRESLAAKRRLRSKLGQKDDDPKPSTRKPDEPRRIRDDDLVVAAGWGGGRRTRQKDKSPPGLKGF